MVMSHWKNVCIGCILPRSAAEKSPHVGPTTSFEILIDRKRYDVTDEAFKELKKKKYSRRGVAF